MQLAATWLYYCVTLKDPIERGLKASAPQGRLRTSQALVTLKDPIERGLKDTILAIL